MSAEGGLQKRGAAAEGKEGKKQLSVVVPAYDETDNIRPLCERLFKAVKGAGLEAELLIVDDESPGSEATAKIVKELAGEGHEVRIHCRKRSEGRGLSSAVLLGFQQARYTVLLCMDADLQHEPESVPDVARPVLEGTAEFTVGSRHVGDGGLGFDWSASRRLVSWGATMLAWPLAGTTDPMSGFFCTSREVLERGRNRLNPIGFKIALEIMVRCQCKLVTDVPITFRERVAGESKMSAKQIQGYLLQLAHLYWEKYLELFLAVLLIVFATAILGFAYVPQLR